MNKMYLKGENATEFEAGRHKFGKEIAPTAVKSSLLKLTNVPKLPCKLYKIGS